MHKNIKLYINNLNILYKKIHIHLGGVGWGGVGRGGQGKQKLIPPSYPSSRVKESPFGVGWVEWNGVFLLSSIMGPRRILYEYIING